MARAVRLAWRQQRFELVILLGATLLLVLVSLALAWGTRAVRADELACYAAAPPPVEGSTGTPCPQFAATARLLENGRQIASALITVGPFVLGLFLGAPLVSREIESGTATLAWSLSRSRVRWLLVRGIPVLAVVLAAAVMLGAVGELLTAVAPWNEGVALGFQDYGARGPLVVARAAAVLGIGLAIGALLGRQLPALLVSGLATAALMVSIGLLMDDAMRREAEPIAMRDMQEAGVTKVYGSGFVERATGKLIGFDEYYARPDAVQVEEPPGMTPVVFAVPGRRYPDFMLRETAALAAVAAAATGGAVGVTVRRRPA